MTTHLEALRELLTTNNWAWTPERKAAVEYVVELLTSAQAMDEREERAHCFKVAEELTLYEWTAVRATELIERERALANIDGYVRCAQIEAVIKDAQRKVIAELQAKLDSLRAPAANLEDFLCAAANAPLGGVEVSVSRMRLTSLLKALGDALEVSK